MRVLATRQDDTRRDVHVPTRPVVRVSNHVTEQHVRELLPRAASVIGPLASATAVIRVARRNVDSVWLLYVGADPKPSGFQACLLLNNDGKQALIDRRLDLANPDIQFICQQTERPAILYVWAVFAPGRSALALSHVVDRFASPHYAATDVVTSARTLAGARAIERLGFEQWSESGRNDLVIVRRSAASVASQRPRFDSYDPKLAPTGVKVVHNSDEYFQVAAIRAAVFIGEQQCPYFEEFDGNDFAATHLIAYVNGEPAGCMRIRFFGDCAKMERLAVRREFRKSRTSFNLVKASVELCRQKGFRKLYGHARNDLLRFWQSFGFKRKLGTDPFTFSDQTFLEMEHPIEPPDDAVGSDSGPYRIIRPEGVWDKPGVLEQSATRIAMA